MEEEKNRIADEQAKKAEEDAKLQREKEAAEAERVGKEQEEAALIIKQKQDIEAARLAQLKIEEELEAERIAKLKLAEEADAARIKAEEEEKARQMEEQRKAEQDRKAEKDRRRAERRQLKAEQKLKAEADLKAREEAQKLKEAEDAKQRQEEADRESDRWAEFNAVDIAQPINPFLSQKEIEDKKIEDLRRMREEAKNSPPKEDFQRKQAWGAAPEASPIKEPAQALPPLQKGNKKAARITLEELKKGQVNTNSQMSEQEDLLAAAEEIEKRNTLNLKKPKREEGKESLQKRQDRLKRQRDILLQKKKKEREEELVEYSESGGIGADIAAQATDQPDSLLFKKRITLAAKIKESLANN